MKFNGHIKSSFIDYPHKISTVVFLGGCNFRCPYCHNSVIVDNKGEKIEEDIIIEYLNKRKSMIDGVCISGGEATLHDGLYEFIKKVKDLGYLIKLDTNGTNPAILNKLLSENLIDYIAMDIKAPIDKYEEVSRMVVNTYDIKKSIDIIKASNIDYEFRTTVCNELLSKRDVINIGKLLKGSKRYVVQNFKESGEILCGSGKLTAFSIDDLKAIEKEISCLFREFNIRYN